MVAVLVLFRGGGGAQRILQSINHSVQKLFFFAKWIWFVMICCHSPRKMCSLCNLFHSKRRKGLWTGIGRASGQRVVKVSERSRKTGPSKAVNDLWMSQTGLNRSLMLTYYLILAIMLKPLTGCWFSIFGGFLPLMFCIGKPRWMYMHPKKAILGGESLTFAFCLLISPSPIWLLLFHSGSMAHAVWFEFWCWPPHQCRFIEGCVEV